MVYLLSSVYTKRWGLFFVKRAEGFVIPTGLFEGDVMGNYIHNVGTIPNLVDNVLR